MSSHIHHACRDEMALGGTFSSARIWTSSLTSTPAPPNTLLAIAHWTTCHDFNAKASIYQHQVQLPTPTMSLFSSEGTTPFNNDPTKNLRLPTPLYLPWTSSSSQIPGLLIVFFKISPILSLPLHASVTILSLALTPTGVLLFCAELYSWHATPSGFHSCSLPME